MNLIVRSSPTGLATGLTATKEETSIFIILFLKPPLKNLQITGFFHPPPNAPEKELEG
jgi:hypothetical protein